jgi:FHA domain
VNPVDTPHIILKTSQKAQRIQLSERKVWTIGRDRANFIRIPDQFASRFHARLEIFEGRHCCFWDLNSSNGSLHNNQPIQGGVLLNHGDCISIGSADLILKHSFVTAHDLPQPPSNQQVMMVHASAIQGKIWQEILLSQNIAVLWETPGVDLRQLISLRTTTNTLPQLLIVDVRAVSNDIDVLSQWCRAQQIKVQILLIDSRSNRISKSEQSQAKARGFLDLYPAFSQRLLNKKSGFEQPLQTVLKGCGLTTPKYSEFFKALETLDQLLNQTSRSIADRYKLEAGFDPGDISLDDLTSLKVDPRKLKQAFR